jgi:tetratricopeptide (TPR) repeat protein
MNDWKNAEEKLLIALDIATEKGKKDIKAKVLFHLADMHFKCREYEKALYYYNKCYRLFDGKNTYESKNVMLQIITCDLFANRYNRDTLINYKDISELVTNNRIDEALNDLKSGNDIKCIHTLIAIAEHLYKDKKINAANTVLKQAQTLAKKYKDKNCNIEISELQKQSKIYKILR